MALTAPLLHFFGRPAPLSLRETGWGYIIRSAHPDGETPKAYMLIVKAIAALLCIYLCVMPGPNLLWRVAGCMVVLAVLQFGIRQLCRARTHEVQVDVQRRELRAGIVSPGGKAWIQRCLRFDEIAGCEIRPTEDSAGMWLKIRGESELLPVCLADAEALARVRGRLKADLQPMEQRMGSNRSSRGLAAATFSRNPFPPLAPAGGL